MSHKIKLLRVIDTAHTRYYFIELSQTLFGEMLLERIYGNIAFRSHTGKKQDYIQDKNTALKKFNSIVQEKLKRGYRVGD